MNIGPEVRSPTNALSFSATATGMTEQRTLRGRSRVVAGGEHELRIALPEKGEWKVSSARFGERPLVPARNDDTNLLRVKVVPKTTGVVRWSVTFN